MNMVTTNMIEKIKKISIFDLLRRQNSNFLAKCFRQNYFVSR